MNSRFQGRLAVLTGIALIVTMAHATFAQGTFIALSTRRDVVFDHSGNYLYISTTDGLVRRYNIPTGQFDASYELGGSVSGLDIAPDDTFLLVAQGTLVGSQGRIQRIDLGSGAITNITYSGPGSWDVAIASNNRAFFTANDTALRQIDLATNAISERTDAAGTGASAMITRNASATRLYLLEKSNTERVYTYDAATNTFGRSARRYDPIPIRLAGAVDRTGTIVGTTAGGLSLDSSPGFSFLRSVSGAALGIAFDAMEDRLYYAVGGASSAIVAVNTNTFAALYRLEAGEQLDPYSLTQYGSGHLVASHDGRYLVLTTPTGLRLFTLPQPPYPALPAPVFSAPRKMVFDHAGKRLYLAAGPYIWPYDLNTRSLEAPIHVGGAASELDIAADDSFVIASQSGYGVAQGAFQKIDLNSGAVTNLTYERAFAEGGALHVQLAANGHALGVTDQVSPTGGASFLRDANLATNSVVVRPDAPTYFGNGYVDRTAHLHRSSDAMRIYVLDGGRVFFYEAATDSFSAGINSTQVYRSDAAMNHDGTRVATRGSQPYTTTLKTAPGFMPLNTFAKLDGAVAFDPAGETLYGTSSYLNQIIAYDANTFAERFRFDIGESFYGDYESGLLTASPDGAYVGLITATGFRVYSVPAVQLASAALVRMHGSNSYAVDLPLDGPRAVEPRSGWANGSYAVVFNFGQSLASVGSATVTGGEVSSRMIDPADAHRYIINLVNVANGQTLKITLTDVRDTSGHQTEAITQQVGILLGDTNGNGVVNAADVQQTRAAAGQTVTPANFRADVDANDVINAADATIVRAASGSALP